VEGLERSPVCCMLWHCGIFRAEPSLQTSLARHMCDTKAFKNYQNPTPTIVWGCWGLWKAWARVLQHMCPLDPACFKQAASMPV